MDDTKNTEAPAESSAPTTAVRRERRGWMMSAILGLAVVASLAVGGIGGYAIASASGPGGDRPTVQQGGFADGPQERPDPRHAPGQERPGDERHQGPQGDEPSDEQENPEG